MFSRDASQQHLDMDACARFEKDCQQGHPQPIEQYLPSADSGQFVQTLLYLVEAELEFLWKQQRSRLSTAASAPSLGATNAPPPKIESYLERFASLNQSDHLLRLLNQEYYIRHLYGDRPSKQEYVDRFPKEVVTGEEVQRLFHECGGPSQSATEFSQQPPDIPGYEIERELGRGGMGVVYQAAHPEVKRTVAIKMILAGAHADPEALSRFSLEAEALARLSHPHIVQLFEVGKHEGYPYLVMEYVPGGNLDSHCEAKLPSPRQAAQLASTLSSAVHALPQVGILHRDLKPANILLTKDSVPKISDLDLAKSLQADEKLTSPEMMLGTPGYMAPEQIPQAKDRHELGPATDVYALGAILYHLLTGRPPFVGDSTLEVIGKVLTEDPERPHHLRADVPRDLETICLKCLHKDPSRRYATAGALADDLQRWLENRPIKARPVSQIERMWRWCERKPAVAPLLVSLTLAVILGVSGIAWQWWRAEDRAEFAHQQQLLAEQRECEANDNYRHALKPVNNLTRLAKELKPLAGTQRRVVQRLLTHVEQEYNSLDKNVGSSPELQQNKADMLTLFGDLYLEMNQSGKAREKVETALAIWDKLLRDDAKNLKYQIGQAGSQHFYSWVLHKQGKSSRALQQAQQALTIRKRLSRQDPKKLPRRADFAASLSRVSFRLRAQGNREESLTKESEALAIREQLAKHNEEWMRDFAWQKIRLANRETDLKKALALYDDVLDLIQPYAAKAPDNGQWQELVSDVYFNQGLTWVNLGNAKMALVCYRKCKEVVQSFARQDPENLIWYRRNLGLQMVEADLTATPGLLPNDKLLARIRDEYRVCKDRFQKFMEKANEDPKNLELTYLKTIQKQRAGKSNGKVDLIP